MKKLALKQIALGVFLASYTASSAYASLSATSNKTIIGNAPTIVAPSSATLKYDYKILRNGIDISTLGTAGSTDRKAQVGDVVHIYIKYNDVDGDDADNLITTTKSDATGSVKFVLFNYDVSTSTPGSDVSPSATIPAVIGTNGEYTYTILAADVGKVIGINLTPVSEFGDPDIGIRIKNNNLFASTDGGGEIPGGNGEVIPGISGKFAYIFHVDDIASNTGGVATPNSGAIPLASTAAGVKTPTLGQKYLVSVYDGTSATSAFASSNVVQATNQATTTIKWYVNGGNSAADSTSTAILASAGDFVVQTKTGNAASANEFTIPATNAAGLALISSAPAAKAGLQGFKLNVDVDF